MKLPRRTFLHLAAGAAALSAVSRFASSGRRSCRAAGPAALRLGASLSDPPNYDCRYLSARRQHWHHRANHRRQVLRDAWATSHR